MEFRLTVLLIMNLLFAQAQVFTYDTQQNEKTITHRILMDDSYFIETQFISEPAEFILTRGGFYTMQESSISVTFEFNSNFDQDGLKRLEFGRTAQWQKVSRTAEDLNGKWLMAGRMTEEGEQRRDTSRPRKTMKFLLDGNFQWIAFNTATFQFFGSGGGYYTTDNGKYTEHIEYFSRDNSRVGAILPFDYSIKGTDWHHQGLSSKGNPIHEIWSMRVQ
jgi:hypothetical protein